MALLFINGQWVESGNRQYFDVLNPATGEIVGNASNAGEKETQIAIDAAYEAFSEWSKLTAEERSVFLRKWYELIVRNVDEIARIMTLEQGKPIAEAKAELMNAAKFVEWYAEEGKRIYGETIPAPTRDKRIVVMKQPVGVVAAITPWNFPAAMVARKVAPALAAGCTCVLKPAEQTPLTAVKLIELMDEAGFPKGVINLITGDPVQIGQTFMRDSRVRKITFTGSTEIGKLLMRQSADTMKNISLELGGHSPFIVFNDANLEKAVKGAITAKFRNAGQACTSINRIFVQEGIADDFVQAYRKEVAALKVGNGLEPDTNVGPLIDRQSFAKVSDHVQDAVAKGAKLICGGEGYHLGTSEEAGYFFQPTVLAGVTKEMKIMREETFGPVAPIITFRTEDEVVQLANDSLYGLVAYLFTESLSCAIRVGEKLEYGILGINDGQTSAAQAPFGGFKESGLGREGGRVGIESFLEMKFMSISI